MRHRPEIVNPWLAFNAFGWDPAVTFQSFSAEFGSDKLAEPQVRGVVIPLAMPDHSQDERRQAERFGTGDEVESFAKSLHD